MEKITMCGDNCLECPRYNASTDEELRKVAELWYRVDWRDSIVTTDEIRCSGCFPQKKCTYGITVCADEKGVDRCRKCSDFPCDKIGIMLGRSAEYRKKCREVCSPEEYEMLEMAFFHKEENLKK